MGVLTLVEGVTVKSFIDPDLESGSREAMEELMDTAGISVGVLGCVIGDPSTYVAWRTSCPDETPSSPSGILRRRTAIRTACPDANPPRTFTTPAGKRRPPESRRERTRWAPASMITVPEGVSVWVVHDLRSRKGVGEGVNNVCGGRVVGTHVCEVSDETGSVDAQ